MGTGGSMECCVAEDEQVKRWRNLAEEARAFAESMTSADAQATMRRIADEYDNLAARRHGGRLH